MKQIEFHLIFNLATLEIGSWLSVFLFGIATSQAYSYYQRFFGSDKWQIKTLVSIVWLCELAHTSCTTAGFYTISIVLYNKPDQIFAKSPVGYTISMMLSGVIATLVQVYFAHRVWSVTGMPYLAYISWSLSFLRFLGTIALTVILATRSLSDFQQTWVAAATWGIGAVVDILIAVPLTIFLASKRRDTIRMGKILDRIIAMTLQTGLFTSVSTIAITICFITIPHTFVWGAVASALAKTFSISLFASLNARTDLRRMSKTFSFRIDGSRMEAPIFKSLPLDASPTESTYYADDSPTVYHSFQSDYAAENK